MHIRFGQQSVEMLCARCSQSRATDTERGLIAQSKNDKQDPIMFKNDCGIYRFLQLSHPFIPLNIQ